MNETLQRVSVTDCEKLMEITSLLQAGPCAGLRRKLLEALRALIPHDLGACHWMQPSRHEIAAWYEPECRPLPVTHQEFWRLIQQHPLNGIAFGQPSRAWKLSDVIPRRQFRDSELYTLLYQPLGVDCEITAVLPDRRADGTFFLLSLHRGGTDFTERERNLLNLLLPHIARAQYRLAPAATDAGSEGALSGEVSFERWLQRNTSWQLSRRETSVLFWLCQGKTNDEIGIILGIAGRTAETHALRLYPKIGVENRYGAITTVTQLAARASQEAAGSTVCAPAGFHRQ